MNITSKSRYALKIMMDLAEYDGPLIQRADIARRQGIPLDYMDQILGRLRECGLIASTRGRSGGYRLARQAGEVSVHDIFTSAEDAFEPVQCLEGGHNCQLEHTCSSRDAWTQISGAIRSSLSGIILADLVAKKAGAKNTLGVDAALLSKQQQECRAPSRAMMARLREGVEGTRT